MRNNELLDALQNVSSMSAWIMTVALPSASIGGVLYTLMIVAGYLFMTRTRKAVSVWR